MVAASAGDQNTHLTSLDTEKNHAQKPVCLMMVLCVMGLYGVAHGAVGSITGTVTDKDSGERLSFVRVAAFQNGQEEGYVNTNF